MLQTRHCARADCGEEFTEEGFHLMCPKCRKMIQREKERIAARIKVEGDFKFVGSQDILLDWWLPQ